MVNWKEYSRSIKIYWGDFFHEHDLKRHRGIFKICDRFWNILLILWATPECGNESQKGTLKQITGPNVKPCTNPDFFPWLFRRTLKASDCFLGQLLIMRMVWKRHLEVLQTQILFFLRPFWTTLNMNLAWKSTVKIKSYFCTLNFALRKKTFFHIKSCRLTSLFGWNRERGSIKTKLETFFAQEGIQIFSFLEF